VDDYGRELSHIENAKLADVKAFFHKHYNPTNAILVMAGNIQTERHWRSAEKWFGNIPAGEKYTPKPSCRTETGAARIHEVKADVPLDAIYKAFSYWFKNQSFLLCNGSDRGSCWEAEVLRLLFKTG
jgi:predicted Zn-dependent peptidase